MKKLIVAGLVTLFSLTLWSCQQNQTVSPEVVSGLSAARVGSDTTGFYCRDSLTRIDASALPASVTSYISTSYVGATVTYAAKDDTGNFLVAITQNDQRKTLLFNADGTFGREVSLSRGGKRGGKRRDSLTSVAVSALPANLTSYITTNYSSASITAAALDSTRGYLVMITQNGQRRTLLFNTDGTFNQEIVRGTKGNYTTIEASALPAAVTSYISTNYAGSTIKLAAKSSTGQFKLYLQTSGGQLIELYFAANGTFVQAGRRRR